MPNSALPRVVVIEFAGFDQARAFADAPEFTELRDLIARSARARMILAEGVQPRHLVC